VGDTITRLQGANICKERRFGPLHIVTSLLYESYLKVKANSPGRLHKFEFDGFGMVICKPCSAIFLFIFFIRSKCRNFAPFWPWQTRVYVNLIVIIFGRHLVLCFPLHPCKCQVMCNFLHHFWEIWWWFNGNYCLWDACFKEHYTAICLAIKLKQQMHVLKLYRLLEKQNWKMHMRHFHALLIPFQCHSVPYVMQHCFSHRAPLQLKNVCVGSVILFFWVVMPSICDLEIGEQTYP